MNIKYVGEHHPRQKWQNTYIDLRNFVVCYEDKGDCLKILSIYPHTSWRGCQGFALLLCGMQAEARNLQINCVSHFAKLRTQPGGILA